VRRLAFCTDISLLVLGGELKRKENLSARLGDVLSYLFLASSVKKYHHDHGYPVEENHYVQWCLEYCLYHSQTALSEFCDNFPHYFIGKILKFLIFPLGKTYKLPSDKLNYYIAKTLLSPSKLRDKLSICCYINKNPEDIIGRLENAFEDKTYRADIIQVDEF
jgi:acyl-CoA dehydrogenase